MEKIRKEERYWFLKSLDSIKESNRLKKVACKNCMEKLKGILTDDQFKQFEAAYQSAAEGYTFKRKGDKE